MPANKWFMDSIEQTLTAAGYRIVITTDVPSHLWMRWTIVPPKEHLIQRTKRGLSLMLEKYYCFDVYEDNEQEEAGDTLEHTFIKEPWPICETRYFYFHGEISGTPSPSTTAIFKKHRPYSPVTQTFYPDAHPETTSVDGDVIHDTPPSGLTWTELIAAPGNNNFDAFWTAAIYIHATLSSYPNKWSYLSRGILLFDTSSLPPDCVILSATLSIYGHNKGDTLFINPDINVYSSNPVSNIELENADYGCLGSIPLCDTPITYDAFSITGYNEFALNAAGLALISKNGITKLGLRNPSYDVAAVAPAWSSDAFAKNSKLIWYTADKGGIYKPKLTITYREL